MEIYKIIKNIIGFCYFIYFHKILKKNLVFLFHDINNSPSKYSRDKKLYLTKKKFLKIINHISKHFKIMSPNIFDNKVIIQNNFALIPFDDGYKSYIKTV